MTHTFSRIGERFSVCLSVYVFLSSYHKVIVILVLTFLKKPCFLPVSQSLPGTAALAGRGVFVPLVLFLGVPFCGSLAVVIAVAPESLESNDVPTQESHSFTSHSYIMTYAARNRFLIITVVPWQCVRVVFPTPFSSFTTATRRPTESSVEGRAGFPTAME